MPQAIDYDQLKSDIEAAVEFQVLGNDAYLVLDAHHLDLEEGRFDLNSAERRAVMSVLADLYKIPTGQVEMAEDKPFTEFSSPAAEQDISLYRLINDDGSVTYYLAMPDRTPDDFVATED